jgi:hypothetical protein
VSLPGALKFALVKAGSGLTSHGLDGIRALSVTLTELITNLGGSAGDALPWVKLKNQRDEKN